MPYLDLCFMLTNNYTYNLNGVMSSQPKQWKGHTRTLRCSVNLSKNRTLKFENTKLKSGIESLICTFESKTMDEGLRIEGKPGICDFHLL